jgi:outer membrane protein OmpA-like peptidoglycan-associated protein
MKNSLTPLWSFIATLPLVFALLNAAHLSAQDASGCTDPTFITRYPGSVLQLCQKSDDGKETFHFTKLPNKEVEGKVAYYNYRVPSNISLNAVARNLSTALRQANWTNLYRPDADDESCWHRDKTWLRIRMGGGAYTLSFVTEIPLTQDIVATAADLDNGLNSNGHAVVPGILFDTGKAVVKDESKPALDEVAKLLTNNPKLKLWVVGHTDSVGSTASNLDLSKRRAAAVIAVLITQYHIAAARLDSFGAGPYAPVASNDKEEGRALNRRVELVKQ